MIRYVRPILLVLVASVFMLPPAYPWDEEILNGHYSYVDKSLSISFDWRIEGIKNLTINARKYGNDKVSLDRFGDIECYQIKIQENRTESKIIRMVFLLQRGKVAFVSGYFAILKNLSEDGHFDVSSVRGVVFKYTAFGSNEKQ